MTQTNLTRREADDPIFSKIAWRILPLLVVCYVVAYIDRVNVSLAKLQMLGDLHMSNTAYGLGAGIFFIGYLLCELPSNLIMHRVGARYWIARIMVTWGVIAAAMAFTAQISLALGFHTGTTVFLALRFLLGAAEAGFFPGLILYSNYWFPTNRQGHVFSILMAAQPVSFVIGLPISGWLLDRMNTVLGMPGWSWMIALEALPAIILGFVVLVMLPNGPKEVKWLDRAERERLDDIFAHEDRARNDAPLSQVIRMPQLWMMMLFWFLVVIGVYGINFWLPTLITETGLKSGSTVGFLSAIPYFFCAIVMIVVARHAEKHSVKHSVIAWAAILGGIGLVAGGYWGRSGVVVTIITMSVAMTGAMTASALFWSLPGAMLSGRAVAAAAAAINSVGNIGGFTGPSILGFVQDYTGSEEAGLLILGVALVIAGVLAATVLSRYARAGQAAASSHRDSPDVTHSGVGRHGPSET